jgi:hypothetical protein
MNIRLAVDVAYEDKTLKELVNAPVSALQGVTPADAEHLAAAFQIHTIGDLARCRFFHWADAITKLAEREA